MYGRTDGIRSCSVESVAFAKCMNNFTLSNSEKIEKMKTAIAAHKAYANMANAGNGIERHLMGLNLISKEKSIMTPSIFLDEGYIKSTNFRMVTSQVMLFIFGSERGEYLFKIQE